MSKFRLPARIWLAIALVSFTACGGIERDEARMELLAVLEEIPGLELWDTGDCDGDCPATYEFDYDTTAFGAFTAVQSALREGTVETDCQPADDECRASGIHAASGLQLRFLFQSDFGSAVAQDA